MKAVVFLSGRTMGDALGGAGRLWAGMFERLGYKFVEVNLADSNALALLNETVRTDQVEAVISFVGMAADLAGTTSEGKQANFWQSVGIPFISIYGDTPAYFFDRHVLPGKSFASLYAFPEHYMLRKRLPRVSGLLATIPPFVVDPVDKSQIDFSSKERGKLLFLKNGNDPDKLLRTWSTVLSERMYEMISDLACELAAHLDSDRCNDIDTLVTDYFRAKGLDVDALINVRLFFIAQLDDYCRRLKSTMIAEALLDFPVEVHGYNWEHVDFSRKRATLVPAANFSVSRSLIKTSLGVIDMSPNTQLAPHERHRRAFGAYTLCVTNEQEYFRHVFPKYDTFSFKFDKASIQSRVADVVRYPKQYTELGVQMAELFRESQEDAGLTRYLLDIAHVVRLENSSRPSNLQDYFAWPPNATS